MKNCIGLFVLVVILFSCKTDTNKVPAETVVEKFGNPIFEGWYADPEAVVFDATYWVYSTYSAAFEE